MTAAFDRWLFEAWRLPRGQLLGFRTIACAYVFFVGIATPLLLVDAPDALLRPPLGPFMWLSAYPPPWVHEGLRVVACIALALLVTGRAPRTSGAVASFCAMLVSGFAFSGAGKIDHNLLLVLAPLVCGFATAPRGEGEGANDDRAWPVAAFAAVMGFSLFTSAVFKFTSGWLALEDSSVQGAQLRNLYVYGRDQLLAPLAARADVGWFWETLDWGTVAVEGVFLVAPFFPWLMRLAIVAMSGLHLGIVFLMNISFAGNIVVYAFFMRWPAIVVAWGEGSAAALGRVPAAAAVAGGGLAGALLVAIGSPLARLGDLFGPAWVGAGLCALGTGFVALCAWQERGAR